MTRQGRQVPDWGDPASRLILIGEAPGQEEERRGQPFIGSSGLKLNEWWQLAGLHRGMFYITNVVPWRPYNNDISKVPPDELDYWSEQLRLKISQLPDPFIIIPTGKTALKALLGKDNISDLRGSILSYDDGHRTIKVIPTLHPAATLRQKKFESRCVYDWMRIAYESGFREVNLPQRDHKIAPTIDECVFYRDQILKDTISHPLAVDIETHPQEGITCVGFAWSRDYSFTIPLGVRRQIHLTGNKPKEVKERETKKANDRISKAVYDKEYPLDSFYTKKRELNAIEKWKNQRKPLKVICRITEEWEQEQGITIEPWESDGGYFITVGYWKTEEENEAAKQIIRDLIQGDNPLIFHNGFYDTYWLKDWLGCEINNWHWDTLCLKGDTEVFTKKGWKRLDALKFKERVLQWDKKTWDLTYCVPEHRRYKFRGSLVKADSRYHKCSYTPNHRIPFMWQSKPNKVGVKKAEEIKNLKAVYIPNSGIFRGGKKQFHRIRLLVAVQADGTSIGNYVYFDFKKERKIKRLIQLCNKSGIIPQKRPQNKNRPDVERFAIRKSDITDILELLDPEVKLFGSWLLSLELKARLAFLHELQFWDGGAYRKKTCHYYYTSKKENAEWVSTVAHFTGKSSFISESKEGCFCVSIKNRTYVSSRETHYKEEPFSGHVYCLTTKTGFFPIRSNGRILITGNSMHHCLVSNEEHSLDFLASVYTSEPFWKKETKEAEASGKYYKKQEVLWRYNGKDVAVTFELYEVFLRMLQSSGRLDFYWKHYYNLFEPLLETSLVGIKADIAKRNQKREEFQKELDKLFVEIEALVGKPLHGSKALSNKKVQEYLYDDLRLQKQKRYRSAEKEKTVTADELAIRTLMLKFPEKLNEVGEKILRCQRLNKLLGYLKENKLDPDGRLRCQFKFNTTSGRLASGGNPYGRGDNLQNQDRELRGIYVAG